MNHDECVIVTVNVLHFASVHSCRYISDDICHVINADRAAKTGIAVLPNNGKLHTGFVTAVQFCLANKHASRPYYFHANRYH